RGVAAAAPASPWSPPPPQPPGGGAEGEPLAGVIERERMPVHDIISVRLGETLGEDLEALAAVAGARDRELALARDAFLVLDLGHEPGRIRLARVHDHGKAERRRLDPGDLAERFSLVGGDKNSVVMLHPT